MLQDAELDVEFIANCYSAPTEFVQNALLLNSSSAAELLKQCLANFQTTNLLGLFQQCQSRLSHISIPEEVLLWSHQKQSEFLEKRRFLFSSLADAQKSQRRSKISEANVQIIVFFVEWGFFFDAQLFLDDLMPTFAVKITKVPLLSTDFVFKIYWANQSYEKIVEFAAQHEITLKKEHRIVVGAALLLKENIQWKEAAENLIDGFIAIKSAFQLKTLAADCGIAVLDISVCFLIACAVASFDFDCDLCRTKSSQKATLLLKSALMSEILDGFDEKIWIFVRTLLNESDALVLFEAFKTFASTINLNCAIFQTKMDSISKSISQKIFRYYIRAFESLSFESCVAFLNMNPQFKSANAINFASEAIQSHSICKNIFHVDVDQQKIIRRKALF